MNIKNAVKLFGSMCADHSPEILAGVGIAGFIATVILAVKATPKVMKELEEKKPETMLDEVKIISKGYILPAVTGTLSAVSMIGSVGVSNRRNAALAAALTLTEDNFIEYKDKVKEMIGEKKENKIEEAIAEDHVQKAEVDDKHMTRTGTGATLCLDLVTGQMFYSDVDWIRSRFIDLNKRLQIYGDMDISDYCDVLQLQEPQLISHTLGWTYDPNGPNIELSETSCLKDGVPVFVIGHRNPPRYGFDKM